MHLAFPQYITLNNLHQWRSWCSWAHGLLSWTRGWMRSSFSKRPWQSLHGSQLDRITTWMQLHVRHENYGLLSGFECHLLPIQTSAQHGESHCHRVFLENKPHVLFRQSQLKAFSSDRRDQFAFPRSLTQLWLLTANQPPAMAASLPEGGAAGSSNGWVAAVQAEQAPECGSWNH